jgi:hypothetical protein
LPNHQQIFEMQLQAKVKEQQTLQGHMWELELSSNVCTVSMAGDSSLLRHYAASLRVTGPKDHNALITKVKVDQEFLHSVRNRSSNTAIAICLDFSCPHTPVTLHKCPQASSTQTLCCSLKVIFTTASFQIPDISDHT